MLVALFIWVEYANTSNPQIVSSIEALQPPYFLATDDGSLFILYFLFYIHFPVLPPQVGQILENVLSSSGH